MTSALRFTGRRKSQVPLMRSRLLLRTRAALVTSRKCLFLNKKLMETCFKWFGYYPASSHEEGNQNCPLRGSIFKMTVHSLCWFWVPNSIFKHFVFCTSNIVSCFRQMISIAQNRQQTNPPKCHCLMKKWNGRKSEDVPFARQISKREPLNVTQNENTSP